eukprot:jgi/Chlat1/5949/Chrsp4S06265
MCLAPQQPTAAAPPAAVQPADTTSAVLPPPAQQQQQDGDVLRKTVPASTSVPASSIASTAAAAAAAAAPASTTCMLPQQQPEAGVSLAQPSRANAPTIMPSPDSQGRTILNRSKARTDGKVNEREEGISGQRLQNVKHASPLSTVTTGTQLCGSSSLKFWLMTAVVAVTAVILGQLHTATYKQETTPTTAKSKASTLLLQVTLGQLTPNTLKQQSLALTQLEATSAALAKQADDISLMMRLTHARGSSKQVKVRKHLAGLYQELSRSAADQRTLCSLTRSALSLLFDNIASGLASFQEDWHSKKLQGLAGTVDILMSHMNQLVALIERAQLKHTDLQEHITQVQQELHHARRMAGKRAEKSKEKKKVRKAETDQLDDVEFMVQEDLLQATTQRSADDFKVLHAIENELIALRRDMENSKHAIQSLQHDIEFGADLSPEDWTSVLNAVERATDEFQMQT